MEQKTRNRKKGRIKKKISEWEFFWEGNQGFLGKPLSWHEAIPEVLHIAISLQQSEPKEILDGLIEIRLVIKGLYGVDWKGNLSNLIQLLQQNPPLIEVIENSIFDNSIRCLITTYNKLFNVRVPDGNLIAHRFVYRAYHELEDRHNDTSILCKYILCKFLNGDKNDVFNLFAEIDRAKILVPDFASQVTPNWILIAQNDNLINYSFGEFIWGYNIKHLPFIVVPDSITEKREVKNFKKNKMNLLKEKLDTHFSEFKKINLFGHFNRYVAEVFMGFISRVNYLAVKIVEQEERHEGEIAESTLRLLYESRVKFLWLNQVQDLQAIKQFREYKVGREKLFLDYLQEKGKDHESFDSAFEKIKEVFNQYRRSEGVDEYKLAIEKGDAFEKTVADMAKELGEDEEMMYYIIYKRTSDVIHSNWRIVENYHLERSLNPAQDNLLRYSESRNTYAGLLPSYIGLMLAISSLIKFLEYYEELLKENKKIYNSLKRFHSMLNKKYYKQFNPSSVTEKPTVKVNDATIT
jgi:hypothetical protein